MRQNVNQILEAAPEEEVLFNSLRAASWDEFHGQDKIKEAILIGTTAAKERGEALDHILFYGPPGLGKTTLSHLIAKEMGSNIKITSGTALTKVGDLAAILTNLEPGDVLFVDEIHRMPKTVEETLYPAMEDYALDIVIGKGPSARTVRLDLPKFTLVGATTRFGVLAGPFRDRFGLTYRLHYYEPNQLKTILQKAAKKMDLDLDDESATQIAKRSRGTPRIALKLLRRVRDFCQVKCEGKLNAEIVNKALDLLEVDKLGLTDADRHFLKLIIEKHKGGPVGLTTIAATLSEDENTVEEVIEPFLLQIGFLQKTPKGRVITEEAHKHLGIKYASK
ncbi:MAG: Holliday junction branch migration DNA helicase RuvB [Pseudomonadales bacterium]|jgi:Holliday junction DNA helicase RuvB|nr:Holliday junction branch migration DNA helicase RuvB [Pseudomonadales bacterium]